MGFFDKVTKAVGDAVDKTKKEADQFMRIQRIKGEIGDIEKKIAGFRAEIQQATTDAGTKAVGLVRAGMLAAPDIQPFADRIAGLEQQVAAEQAAIAGKRADIERIKAEDDEPAATAAATAAPPPAAAAPATPPPVAATPVAPPPIPDAAPAMPPPIPTDEPK